MIKYIELRWSNCFSYGENNSINFVNSPILQLVGKNGRGKSSIALILEEVLFNKNSKGIKKASILNRHVKSKQYSIELDLEKDGVFYTIKTSRASTQAVNLLKNGVDISSHTATATLKDIERLIGYDHKTFSQIVYQSSASSLEFLTATDTARKKFLIDLLNLGRYEKALAVVKEEASKLSKEIAVLTAKKDQSAGWLAKYNKPENLQTMEFQEVPSPPAREIEQKAEIALARRNLGSDNKIITQNLQYKHLLKSVELIPPPELPRDPSMLAAKRVELSDLGAEIKQLAQQSAKLVLAKEICPTCGTKLGVDNTHIIKEKERIDYEAIALTNKRVILESEIKRLERLESLHIKHINSQQEYEKYFRLFNPKLPESTISDIDLQKQEAELNAFITKREQEIQKALQHNSTAAAHNTKAAMLQSQINEFKQDLEESYQALEKLVKHSSNLAVLVKAFSTTGLVAYKIECLVKDLEDLTNEYLAEMADGRFQLKFEISSADKLNVVIIDNGSSIEISALSTGEMARVNISALLGIRKLTQSLSNTRSNLLILDETLENLDLDGKERLVEVLLNEPDLNTLLISHSFTHPLIDRVSIVKEDNISRIE